MTKFLYLLFFPGLFFAQTPHDEIDMLFRNKDFLEAERLIKQCLKTDSNNLKLTELLGDALGSQKKWDAAMIPYKKLVETKPNKANYHYKYAGVLGMKALDNKFKAITYLTDVKNHFVKATELDSTHIEARRALVELWMQLPAVLGGSKVKALFYADQLETLSKVDGYLAKGYVYAYEKQFKSAETYYMLALDESPTLACYQAIISFYENTKEVSKLIKYLEAAHQLYQNNDFQYQLGRVAAEYHIELHKGETCLLRYIENHTPNNTTPKAWAYYYLAIIQQHKNNSKVALRYIDLALLEAPEVDTFVKLKKEVL